MTTIEFNCDRCGRQVRGLHTATMTGGFYDVSPGKAWAAYARKSEGPDDHPSEHFVCDACIQSMPEYQAIYGVQAGD